MLHKPKQQRTTHVGQRNMAYFCLSPEKVDQVMNWLPKSLQSTSFSFLITFFFFRRGYRRCLHLIKVVSKVLPKCTFHFLRLILLGCVKMEDLYFFSHVYYYITLFQKRTVGINFISLCLSRVLSHFSVIIMVRIFRIEWLCFWAMPRTFTWNLFNLVIERAAHIPTADLLD